MKKILKKAVALALAGIMAISVLGISAFADKNTSKGTSSTTSSAESQGNTIVSLTKSSDKNAIKGLGNLCSDGCFTVDTDGAKIKCNTKFDDLSTEEQAKHRQQALNKLGSVALSAEAKDAIKAGFEGKGSTDAEVLSSLFANTKGDLFGAMKIVAPFNSTIGILLGIAVILIILLLIASTTFDLVYIGLPMARNVMDGKADQQGKERPFGVSTDAVRVVNENESNDKGAGGNMYVAYFKKRVITYIILAICIFYLISGQLSGVISWLLGLVSGV